VKNNAKAIILAVHGFNDYSNAFQIPASFFKKFEIETFAFDLRGFGKNSDSGIWHPIEQHKKDLLYFVKKIRKKNPNKKLYLLGESMGGAIVTNLLVEEYENISIDGVILVSPAIWNFSEANLIKSSLLNFSSFFFPYFKFSGKNIVKVRPSDNEEMLKNLSKDPLFIHQSSLQSLSGIVKLMDISYIDFKKYFKDPNFDTLVLVPIVDEIVPRKPLLNLLQDKDVVKHIGKKIRLGVYDENFHMLLRDIDGDRITREIKEWIFDRQSVSTLNSFRNNINRLKNSSFFHKLD